jgi:hypothetical protein
MLENKYLFTELASQVVHAVELPVVQLAHGSVHYTHFFRVVSP